MGRFKVTIFGNMALVLWFYFHITFLLYSSDNNILKILFYPIYKSFKESNCKNFKQIMQHLKLVMHKWQKDEFAIKKILLAFCCKILWQNENYLQDIDLTTMLNTLFHA